MAWPPTRRETLSELGLLRQEILDRREEFGLLAPSRQRLCLTYWTARTRAMQHRYCGDNEVEGQAQAIIRLLGELAGVYWPGNVPALTLNCTAAKAMVVLDKRERPAVRHWEDVAEAMADALRGAEADESKDEHGWADEPAMAPRCEHPEEEFAGVFGQIAKRFPEDEELSRPPPKALPPVLLPTSVEERRKVRKMVLTWARVVRWVRHDVLNAGRVGRALGRLRWIASRWPGTDQESRQFRDELEKTLDERHCPGVPWARLLGRDADKKARRQARQRLGQRIATLDCGDLESLWGWFLDAVRDVDLPTLRKWMEARPDIRDGLLRHLHEHADLLQSLSKTQRRRARRLLEDELVLGPEEDLVVEDEPDGAESEALADEARPSSLEIPEEVLAFTSGKRAVFVGNRGEDPELRQALLERLSFAELDFVDGNDPRRLDGLSERIDAGSYQLVLAATGFLSHGADQRLQPRCRAYGIPYLRVNRGRLAACVRALVRHVGAA